MKVFWESLRMLLWMTILTGLAYPLLITSLSYVFLNSKAAGSFIEINGKLVGSKLIAQKFTSDRYFWGRPSAVNYNPLSSGGSNLGPTSAELKKIVVKREQILREANKNGSIMIPSELLFASGSGLDPHIGLEAAYFQIDRIARARSMESINLKHAVDSFVEKPFMRLLGRSRVNVLLLNLYLDKMQAKDKHG